MYAKMASTGVISSSFSSSSLLSTKASSSSTATALLSPANISVSTVHFHERKLSSSFTTSTTSTLTSIRGRRRRRALLITRQGMTCSASSLPSALLFDCDGVLVDTEKDGHRISFNETFAEVELRRAAPHLFVFMLVLSWFFLPTLVGCLCGNWVCLFPVSWLHFFFFGEILFCFPPSKWGFHFIRFLWIRVGFFRCLWFEGD